MTRPGIAKRLSDDFPRFTRAEKAVASYMLSHLDRIPFETAASIADNVGVSQMTVGRFLRGIGFQGLAEFKGRLRDEMDAAPILISDRITRIRAGQDRDSRTWENFELEIDGILSAYELRDTPAWQAAVDALAGSRRVHVCGFQTIAGIASDFAARLAYARPDTRLLEGRDGTFSDLLAEPAEGCCLVLFEMRRYTAQSHDLLAAAQEAGVLIVVICDSHCYWARDYTDIVLPLRTGSRLFWDAQAPFSSLAGLLVDDTIARLGDAATARLERLRGLQDRFGAFRD